MKFVKAIIKYPVKKMIDYFYSVSIKHDDVFLVSYPRSGNTWVSFLLANLMSLDSGKDIEVNFFNVIDFIPEFPTHIKNMKDTKWGRFPRIIKSHEGANDKFNKAILIVRDPRDVMVSYYHYLKNLNQIPESYTISDLIRNKKFGIKAWVKHSESWLERASKGKRTHCFLYEDIIEDTKKQVLGILHILGINLKESVIDEAIKRSTKERMRSLEMSTRDCKIKLHSSQFTFIRKGQVGEGLKLNKNDLEYIRKQANHIAKAIGYNLEVKEL